MSIVEGTSVLIGGPDGRYPYDGEPDNIVWPVLLSDLKSHAQISHNEDDGLLSADFAGYLADATEEVETRGQISLVSQKRRITLDRLPCEESIAVLRGPLQSVTEIKYLDPDGAEQTLATTLWRANFRSKRGSVYFDDTSSLETACGEGVCWIDMICGYGTTTASVPAQWRQIVAVIATHAYERRELASGGGLDDAMEKVVTRKIIAAGGTRRYV